MFFENIPNVYYKIGVALKENLFFFNLCDPKWNSYGMGMLTVIVYL